MKKYRFIHRLATLFLCLFILSSTILLTFHSTWYYKISKNYCDTRFSNNCDATAITAANYDAYLVELINPRTNAISLPSYELNAEDIHLSQQLRCFLFTLYGICLFSSIIVICSLYHLQNLRHYQFLLTGSLITFPVATILLLSGGAILTGSFSRFFQLLKHGEQQIIHFSELLEQLIYPGYTLSHILLFYLYLILIFLLCLILYKIFSRQKNYF